MRNFLKSKLSLVILLLLSFSSMFGLSIQEIDPGAVDFEAAFLDSTAMAGSIIVIIDLLKNTFPKIFMGNFLRFFSYLLPLAIGLVGWKLGWGFLGELEQWWEALIAGVYVSVVTWFGAYLGILNIILQLANIDLKGRRLRLRNED